MYNLLIKTATTGSYNILEINDEQLEKVKTAYLKGTETVTIVGRKCFLAGNTLFKIYTHDNVDAQKRASAIDHYTTNVHFHAKNIVGKKFLPETTLKLMGRDITYDQIGDKEYGAEFDYGFGTSVAEPTQARFVNPERIAELEKIKHADFDLSRLIQLCKELNDNYSRKNYLTVAMLGRSIINHVPPIFGFTTFNEVANNYGTQSFKKNMGHLNVSMRSIADSCLHETIRKKEVLPNDTQVNFSQDLDVLLSEVIRVLK